MRSTHVQEELKSAGAANGVQCSHDENIYQLAIAKAKARAPTRAYYEKDDGDERARWCCAVDSAR